MKKILFIIMFLSQNVIADGIQITNIVEGEGTEIINHSKIQVHYTTTKITPINPIATAPHLLTPTFSFKNKNAKIVTKNGLVINRV